MKQGYHVIYISRTQSSGFESSRTKSFETIEEAVSYIHDEWYDQFCADFEFPSDWDEEDTGMSFPKKEEFTLEKITKKMGKRSQYDIFSYYSQYAGLRPYELILQKH